MKIKSGYILKQVANQTIVVPTGTEAMNFNGIINLNDSGKLLFQSLQQECETDDLVQILMTHYEVDRDTAKKDVLSFVKVLQEKHLLV